MQEPAESNLIYRREINHHANELTQVIIHHEDHRYPTLPRTKMVPCVKCNHKEVAYHQVMLSFSSSSELTEVRLYLSHKLFELLSVVC